MSRKQFRALCFCAVLVGILFLPWEFPGKWIGVPAVLFIGVPWYLIATKRSVEEKIELQNGKRVFSLTLFLLGIFLTVLGVAIDMLIVQELIGNFSIEIVIASLGRILAGVSFFGAGVYVLYLSIGIRKDEI